MATTIRDVAVRAGVSPKTVSRVINGEAYVQDSTRQRVLDAARALNYRPNPAARGLRNARTYALALIYDNPNPYYILALQSGALAACQEAGFGLQVQPCDAARPDLAESLSRLVTEARLAGLILTPPMAENQQLLKALDAAGIRFVCIRSLTTQQAGDAWPAIEVDDAKAAYAIVEHLILLGHARIGFIWGNPTHQSSLARYAGYRKALADYGIVPDEALVLEGEYSFESGFRSARLLFQLADRPTAIFGANDQIAAGVLAAAHANHVNVPYDVSVAGFEDNGFSRYCWPPLTTAHQDTEGMARAAARLLLQTVNQPDAHARPAARQDIATRFTPTLVKRSSTAPPCPTNNPADMS